MPQLDVIPVPRFIAPTPCPRCESKMDIIRIKLVRPDHDLRAFDCPSCHHTEIVTVKNRPAYSLRAMLMGMQFAIRF